MRPFELALALILTARIFVHSRLPRWFKFLPIPIALAQVWLEGYRWQLLPLYLLTILAGIQSLRNLDPWRGRPRGWVLILGIGLSKPLLLLGYALPILLPIPNPPLPGGPQDIGTTTLHLVDNERSDPYAPDPNAEREILVQIWYPAELNGDEKPAPWMDSAGIVAPAIANWVELPTFAFDHLIYATTSSYTDAPISDGRYPVILFSHGYGGFRAQNTFQVQELASHGYIVVAVEHTYGAVTTVFPDGRIALHNPDTLPEGLSDTAYEAAAEALVRQWAADLAFTVDELARRDADPEDFLYQSLNLDLLGVMGHSTGGGTAVQFCSTDPRCDAVLGMDPWLLPVDDAVLAAGAQQPSLHLFSEGWTQGPNVARTATLLQGNPAAAQLYWIAGTEHYDFTDLPSVSPLAHYFNLKGPIDGERVQEIVNTLTVKFFDVILLNGGKGLPESTLAPFAEVRTFKP